MNASFLKISALQLENRALKEKLLAFQSGARYVRMKEDYETIIRSKDRRIRELEKELEKKHRENRNTIEIWTQANEDTYLEAHKELSKKDDEISALKEKIWDLLRRQDEKTAAMQQKHQEELDEKDRVIEELKNRLSHAQAQLGRDSSNSGLPTSRTPIGMEKRIPNSRRSTGKAKGGQPGHEKHTLEPPSAEEVNEITDVGTQAPETVCPTCGSGDYEYTGEWISRYEKDIQIRVVNREIRYYEYRCCLCGTKFYSSAAPDMRPVCQYGPTVQAVALSMLNTANAAINKVAAFFKGISDGGLRPCEGYIAKVQARAAKRAMEFRESLRLKILTERLLYWDDTVIPIDKKRCCLRFYGNEQISYYVAHEKKDKAGLKEDRILWLLTSDTTVMHDHNTVNYNKELHFRNIECCQHLQRDIQKSADGTCHKELIRLKEKISTAVNDRKEAIQSGKENFDKAYRNEFHSFVSDTLDLAEKENEADPKNYGADFEKTLINRIRKHYENYFAWIEDFFLPTTNNLSERALRPAKSHMKISGQFQTEKTADNYAAIMTYIMTCRKNGINEIEALKRLCEDDPLTIGEIFSPVTSG